MLVQIARLLPGTQGINAMVKFRQIAAWLPEASAELAHLALSALLYGALAMWRNRLAATCSTTSSDSTIDSAVTHSLTDHHPQAISECPAE